VFYGFWGVCWNDYKEAEPHLGYQIVRRWKEHWFTAAADGDKRKKRIYQLLCEREKHYAEKIFIEGEVQDAEEPFETLGVDENGLHTLFYSLEQNTEYSQSEQMRTEQQPVQPLGRPFFIFTSNVDGHHQKAGFSPSEVYEIHGSISEWQCSVPCTDELWALPKNFSFTVDRHQMEALPDFPKCIHCDAPARPAVQMYYDRRRNEKKESRQRYLIWKRAACDILYSTRDAKLAILEIGCGTNVSTVRLESEELLGKNPEGCCTLVRINMEYPKCHWRPHLQKHIISIRATAGEALTEIDKHIQRQ